MAIEKVVVVGGGTMGNGIAQVVAGAGLEVTIVDVDEGALDRALQADRPEPRALRQVEKRLREEADATRARISTTTDLDAAAEVADHAIETVIEDIDVKPTSSDGSTRPAVMTSSSPRTPHSSRYRRSPPRHRGPTASSARTGSTLPR